MRTMLFACALIVAFVVDASAQNPCADPAPTGIVVFSSAARMYLQIDDFNVMEIDGTPRASFYEWAYYAPGVNPNGAGVAPLQGPSSVPRNAFALVSRMRRSVMRICPSSRGPPLACLFFCACAENVRRPRDGT